jgi:hypothetical protein
MPETLHHRRRERLLAEHGKCRIDTLVVELVSPRGTDDFTMATVNALVCVAFGWLVL